MSDERHDPKLSAHEDQWLDRVLSEAAPVEPSAALRRAVAEIPLRHPRLEGAAPNSWLGWPGFALRYALAAALVTLAVGAWLGYEASVLPEVVLIDEEAQPGSDDEDWDELAQLAFADRLDEELTP